MIKSMSGCVEIQRKEAVGIIRLVNEKNLNALTHAMRGDFITAFYSLFADDQVRAIYITGHGRAFSAGGDLKILREESGAWSSYTRLTATGQWLSDLLDCPKPIVVGVNGITVGGGLGLALAGDLIYAAQESATFKAGFLKLGLVPDFAMMYTLPRLVGFRRAKEFIYTDAQWNAAEAAEYGLITEAVPAEELEDKCLAVAQQLAEGPIEAFGVTKRILRSSFETSLQEMLKDEALAQSVVHSTESAREGIAAITERRVSDFVAASGRQRKTSPSL